MGITDEFKMMINRTTVVFSVHFLHRTIHVIKKVFALVLCFDFKVGEWRSYFKTKLFTRA